MAVTTLKMRLRAIVIVTAIVCTACAGVPAPLGRAPATATPNQDEIFVPAGAPLPVLQSVLTSDPTDGGSFIPAVSPAGGAYLVRSMNSILLRLPTLPQGARRVGIQVGHWKTDEVPAELAKLIGQTGAIWDDVHEVDVNLDIANRVATLLRRQGIVVDLLPTTVPEGYVADAFLALHADSDGVGELSGFKLAHGPDRGPFEDRLVNDLQTAYADGTGIPYDGEHIGVNMTYYYPFNWARFQHATSAHTPAAILEMGYLSSDDDRPLLVDDPGRIATAIANGLVRFLSETPRAQIFHDPIVVALPPGTVPAQP